MAYQKTIHTSRPETLAGLTPGQWINYDGTIGRYMGVSPHGTIWIAWGVTATRYFKGFANAYKLNALGLYK